MTIQLKLALAGLAAAGLAQAVPGDDAPPPTAPARPASDATIAAIRDAKDPTAAAEAYARAMDSAPGDLEAERAFVRRMIDFGRPEMAETQARDVADRAPTDGAARAVVAYVEAQDGDFEDAVSDVVAAARASPDEWFVQRTAGQLAAWYDTRVDQPDLGDDLTTSFAAMRARLVGRSEYDDAYRRALGNYANVADDAAPPEPAVETAPETTYVETRSVYSDPFVGYYDPWWPGPWTWYAGPTGVVILRDHDRFRDRRERGEFRDRDGFTERDGFRDRDRFRDRDDSRSRGDVENRRGFVPRTSSQAAPERPVRPRRTTTPRVQTPRVQTPRVQPRTTPPRTRPMQPRVQPTQPRVQPAPRIQPTPPQTPPRDRDRRRER